MIIQLISENANTREKTKTTVTINVKLRNKHRKIYYIFTLVLELTIPAVKVVGFTNFIYFLEQNCCLQDYLKDF